MAREGVDLLPVDQDLHGGDCGQIVGQRIDDGVDREDLVERAAGMVRGDFAREVHVGLALVADEQLLQLRALRDRRRHGRLHGLELRLDDVPGLFGGAGAQQDLPFLRPQPQAVVAQVVEPRLDVRRARRRGRLGLRDGGGTRLLGLRRGFRRPARQADEQDPRDRDGQHGEPEGDQDSGSSHGRGAPGAAGATGATGAVRRVRWGALHPRRTCGWPR